MKHPFKYLAVLSLATTAVTGVFAQDSHWNGTTTNTLWSNPDNWNPVGVPPSGNPDTMFQGNVWLDAANGDTIITIGPGDVETPGVGNSTEAFNTIFGPEWGVTLNVYGSLTFDWLLYPVQNNPGAPRSYVNLYDNAVVSTGGAALGLGDAWFYHDAPYVTMNLYSNAQYNSFGGAGLWLGGHLNIYDHAQFLVNGYINMSFTQHQTDGTRSINVAGGTLKLPVNYINGANTAYNGGSGNIYDFIARGIVRAYGKALDTNDLIITDDGTNTIVKSVPLGGALQRVYFQALPRANVYPGTFQQAMLVGDYPSVGAVVLSSSEPGLSPGAFPHPVYSSSNTRVATVDANGMVMAVSPGQATISASVGVLNTTNSVTLTVLAAPTLIHEYKFSETADAMTTADSVPGNSPDWDGTLNGGATLGGGQVALNGTDGYVQLPSGLLTGLDEVTIEVWASFPAPINVWANLYALGNTDGGGLGANYISMQPHTGGDTAGANFGIGDPGQETDAVLNSTLDGLTNIQVVGVYHVSAGTVSLYTNGVLVAVSAPVFNSLTDPMALIGPFFNNQTVLGQALGSDPLNYIGRSLYNSDPMLNGSVDEFRIYNGPLSTARVRANYALGPNQLIGASTNVSVTATQSGGMLTITWPTTSALVNLVSSPSLGSDAVWTPVDAPLTVAGGNYQMIIPASNSALYFRLQQ